ncbi:MAG: amino acid adenylation domain-containing protein [Clostridia bacterium]|nr:amino acid adenylation domain-containing protein [Clostridia bacterium]
MLDRYSQNILISSGKFDRERIYWTRKLEGSTAISSFPMDMPREGNQGYKSKSIEYELDKQTCERLIAISNTSDYGLFIVLLSGIEYLLSRYTGNRDILVAMPIFKQSKDISTLVNNILPLRVQMDGCKTFKELLEQIKETVTEANFNQNIPLNSLAELSGIEYEADGNLNVNTLVLLDSIHDRKYIENLKSDLTFFFTKSKEEIKLQVEYNARLYQGEKIGLIAEHLMRYYSTVLTQPTINLCDIEILEENQRKDLLSLGRTCEIKVHNSFGLSNMNIGAILKNQTWKKEDGDELPLTDMKLYILGKDRLLQPIGIPGELHISGDAEYEEFVKNRGIIAQCIGDDPFISGQKLYRTGVLARWLTDGSMEYLGREEQQVVVEGRQLNLREIEACLLRYESVKEAVVLLQEDNEGCKYICAYVVSEDELELKRYLSANLPEYMIPKHTIRIEKIPVTAHGTVAIDMLLRPYMDIGKKSLTTNEIEKKLIEIWEEVLGVEPIGVEDDFFDLGGNSLIGITLVSLIHKEFNVEVPVGEMFDNSTVEKLACYIKEAGKSSYTEIRAIEEREHYSVSSAQKRMMVINQIEGNRSNYNIYGAWTVDGKLDRERFEETFKALINRHDVFRTSFEFIDGNPVQKIERHVEFSMRYIELDEEFGTGNAYPNKVDEVLGNFIQPFDLGKAPLLRAGLIKLAENKHMLIVDMHHIIGDGTSLDILVRDFISLYYRRELPILKIQYKDFSEWQNEFLKSEAVKEQERYWLNRFSGQIPMLAMPTDYPRPSIQSFEGSRIDFEITEELTQKLNGIAQQTGTTMYMILLAAYNILLSKYSGQDDIVVGSPIAGRSHADLKDIIGVFVNTLVMRNRPEAKKTLRAFLEEVKENSLNAYENQDYQFEELVEKLDVRRDLSRNPLFDVMFILQNMEREMVEIEGLKFAPYEIERNVSMFDMTLTGIESGGKVSMALEYCTKLFERSTMERLSQHYVNILEAAVQSLETRLSDLIILSEAEITQIVLNFNNTKAEYPKDKTIAQLFEEQAERTPDNIAVVFEGKQLTYRELNSRANQLARMLKEKGVGAESVVAIMAQRSMEMIVGIIGILKAGGAYVPIDPSYPLDRIQYMLEDSKAHILLTERKLVEKCPMNIEGLESIIDLGDSNLYSGDSTNIDAETTKDNLAYIIYTSGTTGKPKGVMIEHKSICNTIQWRREEYKLDDRDTVLQLFSYSFDGFITSFFTPIVSGSKVVLLGDMESKDPAAIKESIVKHKATHFIMVPALYSALLDCITPEEAQYLRIVTLAGDSINASLVERSKQRNSRLEIVNEYGPTENSVASTVARNVRADKTITIGRPIANTKVYIVDKDLKPVPIGVGGELCVSGCGLARGYLNRPELTNEKFVPNPFINEKLLIDNGELNDYQLIYRTGDLARWLPDGSIEFLGRTDHQVKIRGFRIELGEIEAHLLRYGQIKEAVVLAKENENSKYLCAYIVAEKELTVTQLREHLSKDLPDYMIPSYFVQLDKLPLTPNGKVDRKALLELNASISTEAEYAEPANEIELVLAQVWQEVLRIDKVGTNSTFFELGGDSIKAIQVSSRLHKYGMKVEIRDLMRNPNIRELATMVKVYIEEKVEQGAVEGRVNLTPIQKWFFEKNFTGMHHWNQAVMLYGKNGFDSDVLRRVFQKIVEHHDALRMVYLVDGENVIQYSRGLDGELFTLQTIDLTGESNYEERIVEEADRIQSSIDLNKGPLVKLGLFKTTEGDHLLIAIHHLVVDGVSWRIIFEDLAAGYEQAVNNSEIMFQEKTCSFKDWGLKIQEYAGSSNLLKERKYWKTILSKKHGNIPVDTPVVERYMKDYRNVSTVLTEEETARLTRQANSAYNTEITDILLAALGLAIKEWAGLESVAVNLEGHGREDIAGEADISRTVGWFTSSYPIVLEMQGGREAARAIKCVKESMRKIPNKGIGYGVLKYLAAPEHKEDIGFGAEPEISFNYLGSFGKDIDTGVFGMSRFPTGQSIHPCSEEIYKIDINGIIAGDRLSVNFKYHSDEYRDETILMLADIYKQKLLEIVEHCVSKERTELTPSDYGDTYLELDELENIVSVYGENIQWIYPLAPMQEGMLFHAIADSGSHAYFEQMSFDVKGNLDIGLVQRSIAMLVERYDILRTGIVHKGLERPRQVVLKERHAKVYFEDISAMAEDEMQHYIESFECRDRQLGFDLTHDILLRVSVLKVGKTKHRFIWSFHHVIMDGWCMPIVFGEFFETYAAMYSGNTIDWEEAAPYREYIHWLERQDREAAMSYWSNYLAGYEEKASIPCRTNTLIQGEYRQETDIFLMDEEVTAGLLALAKEYQVTLNTVLNAIWGIMLQRYNNTTDVVFGAVVSGRPAEVAGIEKMVGLFINAIPVRVACGEDIPFAALLKKVHENAIMSEKYSFCSLAEVQALSALKNGLLDHLIIFENYPMGPLQEGNRWETGIEVDSGSVKAFEQTNYDFNITISLDKQLRIQLTYNSLVYDGWFIHNIGLHFKALVERIINNPCIKLSMLDMLPAKEKELLLYDFNDTRADYAKGKIIHQLFEEQVEKTPDNAAAVFGDSQLTYSELNSRANQLARKLRENGVTADSIVALVVKRSLEMMIGIMGILKAGGAYLPIDPDYPEDRMRYMLEDSGTKVILTQGRYTGLFNSDELGINVVNLEAESLYVGEDTNPDPINNSRNLAYVIYTSGSTGKPKGAMIEHYSVINRINWMQKKYPIGQEDVILQKTPFTFDVSVWELLWWSFVGAKVCFLTPGGEKDPAAMVEAIEKNKATTMHFVPSMLNIFLEYLEARKNDIERLPSLRQVFASGEALNLQQVEKFNSMIYAKHGTTLNNLYGPTEATVDVSYFDCSTGETFEIIPIGKPIDNIHLYVIDKYNNLQPIGVAGELCIAGDGLARGYLNRPELTMEKFVPNPFINGQLKENNYQLMYRTGDLARWLPDGNIEYLGRLDHQVKIRGLRIELGEIEAQLLKHESIKEAVVLAKGDGSNKYLCAYIMADSEVGAPELREHLLKELPDYMVPSYFVQLDKMPLTPNGKVDRKSLPEIEGNVNTGVEYAAPANRIEEVLVGIWQEVLGTQKVGVKDRFFDLGGNSLSMQRILINVEKYFNVKVTIKQFFRSPTVAQLGEIISKEIGGIQFTQPGSCEAEEESHPRERFGGIKADESLILIEDLLPIHDDIRNCLEDSIASVAKWWGRDYQPLFAKSWEFNSKGFRPDALIGECIEAYSYEERIECLRKYCGIQVEAHQFESSSLDDVLQILRNQLSQGQPVIVSLDVYWCPWFKTAYQTYHANHYFTVVGIDQKHLYCIDSSPFTDGDILPIETYKKGNTGVYVTFSVVDSENIDWRSMIKSAIDKLEGKDDGVNTFKAMEAFADAAGKGLDLEREVKGFEHNPFDALLFQRIQQVARGRRQFAELLMYISKRYNLGELIPLAERLDVTGLKWESIRGILIKACSIDAHDKLKEKAVAQIREVIGCEEEIARGLRRIAQQDVIKGIEDYEREASEKKGVEIKEITFINLEEYFNNHGFGTCSMDCTAELSSGSGNDGSGGYFIKEGLPQGNIWEVGAMKFNFPHLVDGVKDNVQCKGQTIPLPAGQYSNIMLLGCAEMGNFLEQATIKYTDGKTETIPLEYTDWSLTKALFNETVAWVGNGAARQQGRVNVFPFDVKIYAVIRELEHGGTVESVELPYCPNIHIFALSLGK